jgi:drug/metabolite transporter (DMT)-like permease
LSAIAMTLYTVAPAHILKEYSSPYLMGWGQLLSGFILLPLCNPFHSGVESWTFFSIGAMGYIIVFGTVVPFLMYFNGLKVIGPVKASLISCSEPLCSVLFSVAFLGTFLALPDYLGVVCIVGTVVMLSLK